MTEPRPNWKSDPTLREGAHDASLTRHEEELRLGTRTEEAGSVRVHKSVDTYPVDKVVERHTEQVVGAGERVAARAGDSGEIETLEDGSVSIPILEEELVVTKRIVVRERLVIRKATVTDQHRIETELRKERVELDADGGVLSAASQAANVGGAPPAPPTGTPT